MITSGALHGHVTGFICERYVAKKVDDLPKPLLLTAKCSNSGELVTTFGIPNLIYSALPGEDEAGGGRRQ